MPPQEMITRTADEKCCVDCKTTKTPLWRSGPAGPKVKELLNFFSDYLWVSCSSKRVVLNFSPFPFGGDIWYSHYAMLVESDIERKGQPLAQVRPHPQPQWVWTRRKRRSRKKNMKKL